ncbi:MAG: type II toxin-antitoxin system RelE/ParE family toxin [Gammaproteobacteria bacterium]|nr:type II toxin-antitoxin system RelE/ParE family toxin [Gammaproteobacteria bacterium]
MRLVRILHQAAEEAEAAAAWYESERQGLGIEFSDAIDAAIDLIEDGFLPLSPMPGQSGAKGARRLILRRFPYDIVVVEQNDEVIVVAFAHHSRKPGYWLGRIHP